MIKNKSELTRFARRYLSLQCTVKCCSAKSFHCYSLTVLAALALAGCGGVGNTVGGGATNNQPLSLIGAVTTLAGSGNAVDGAGTIATFNSPSSITSDGTNLYIADYNNNRIRKVVIATRAVSTLAGSGTYGSTDGIATATSFSYPVSITNDGANLYVTDNNTIRKVVIATGAVTTLAGSVTAGAVDGIGSAARFKTPSGITTDGPNLYVADSGNNKIRQIVIATGAVTTLAGSGIASATDATGIAAGFNFPRSLTTDGINLYVADTGNNKIRQVVIATGAVTSLAGNGTAPINGMTDGVGVFAHISQPTGITIKGSNLFVADYGYHAIRQIVIATGAVTTIAGGTGTMGSTRAYRVSSQRFHNREFLANKWGAIPFCG